MTPWIDELERDLGQAARLRLIANAGGQRRDVPQLANAASSKLAREVGADVAIWLASRFGGDKVDFPTMRGRETERRASELTAAILEAGLTHPTRSANDIATEFGVSSMWVRKRRAELRRDQHRQPPLPLFD